jgi:hypothetical protein
MPELTPPSITLVPAPAELRRRLAVALREVDLLRRLIRISEYAARYGPPCPTSPRSDDREGAACG